MRSVSSLPSLRQQWLRTAETMMDSFKRPAGYNPMRYDCEKLSGDKPYSACFNKIKRPKIEQFAECFPGKINFSDVDGMVEISGNAMLMEWKPVPINFFDGKHGGQRIMYQRITVGRRFTVLCIAGNAETMNVSHRAAFWDGKWRDWKEASLVDVKKVIEWWVKFARANPRIGS